MALDLSTPPQGVPKQFWDNFLKENPKVVQALQVAERDLGYQKAVGLLGQLGPQVQQAWNQTPPEVQKQIAAGMPSNDPDSAEGKAFLGAQPGNQSKQGSPEWWAKRQIEDADTAALEGFQDIDEWKAAVLGPAQKELEAALAGDTAALERLKSVIGNIKDPELAKYVGDYVSQGAQARVSEETLQRQLDEYNKLHSLEDPTITAEEKLMMEVSRREQEQDLRAQREAIASNMRARGVYGSGAELTQGLMAQSEGANRRALEYMSAQANAQKRAFDALVQAGQMSGDIRKSEAQETQYRASAADRASEFNNTLKQNYETWLTEEKARLNKDLVDRETGLANTGSAIGRNKIANISDVGALSFKPVSARAGIRETTGKIKGDAGDRLSNLNIYRTTGEQIAEDDGENW